MTGSAVVLLIEKLVVGIVNAIREEYTYIYLRLVTFHIVGRVCVTYVVFCESFSLGIFLMDWETCSKVGRVGEAIIPDCYLVEVAALVERDDTMFYYVLLVAHGRRIGRSPKPGRPFSSYRERLLPKLSEDMASLC